jgi:hypothetical protein
MVLFAIDTDTDVEHGTFGDMEFRNILCNHSDYHSKDALVNLLMLEFRQPFSNQSGWWAHSTQLRICINRDGRERALVSQISI